MKRKNGTWDEVAGMDALVYASITLFFLKKKNSNSRMSKMFISLLCLLYIPVQECSQAFDSLCSCQSCGSVKPDMVLVGFIRFPCSKSSHFRVFWAVVVDCRKALLLKVLTSEKPEDIAPAIWRRLRKCCNALTVMVLCLYLRLLFITPPVWPRAENMIFGKCHYKSFRQSDFNPCPSNLPLTPCFTRFVKG